MASLSEDPKETVIADDSKTQISSGLDWSGDWDLSMHTATDMLWKLYQLGLAMYWTFLLLKPITHSYMNVKNKKKCKQKAIYVSK